MWGSDPCFSSPSCQPRASPVLLTLLFFLLVPLSYQVLLGSIYSFPLVRYSCLLSAGVLHVLLCLKVYSWCICGEGYTPCPPTPLSSCSSPLFFLIAKKYLQYTNPRKILWDFHFKDINIYVLLCTEGFPVESEVCCCCSVTQSRLTLCHPMDYHWAPLPVRFSRQECWSGLPFSPPVDLPDPRAEPTSPTLQADSLLLSHWGSPWKVRYK